MYRWYAIHTYSGHENKVRNNLEHRATSLGQKRAIRQIVVPTETVQEVKDNQKVAVEKRTMPGYLLIEMDMDDNSWQLVKGTPGVIAIVGEGKGGEDTKPVPLTRGEVDRMLKRDQAGAPGAAATAAARPAAQYSVGEQVKVISGPLSDFSGEIAEINEDAAKLKVLVSIFGRETPVEVGFDQVKKV
ncbi:MAG: transcription termination/antitermination protein NusG [Actinomycetes bacterium]|jgi:transcriptional antiterminator NusG